MLSYGTHACYNEIILPDGPATGPLSVSEHSED